MMGLPYAAYMNTLLYGRPTAVVQRHITQRNRYRQHLIHYQTLAATPLL